MSTTNLFESVLNRTEQRFSERAKERKEKRDLLKAGKLFDANPIDLIESRLTRLKFDKLGDLVAPQVAPVLSDEQRPSPTTSLPGDDAEELQEALAELTEARTRPYYDSAQDQQDRDSFYADIDTNVSAKTLFNDLSQLVRSTHTGLFNYKLSRHVYPWIDLHPDLKLCSIYYGRSFALETFIREDFRIAHKRAVRIQELDLLEASLPYNCEHIALQLWFYKHEPMRADLHHLFACEIGCNSFRSNVPYYDFSDFEEALRDTCGKHIGHDKFEPMAGKGVVARVTLYFMLRYPRQIGDLAGELQTDRLPILLDWHKANPPDEYERYRNASIFKKQGNRNPLIDYPEWVEKIDFEEGIGGQQ